MLNVSINPLIAEIFGPRVFRFSVGQKKNSQLHAPQLLAQLSPPPLQKKNKDFRGGGGVIDLQIEVHRAGGNFFLTHRKTKNPRSKNFRYMGFMETFNI